MAKFQPINILDFLREFLNRYTKKSPTFFRVLQVIFTIAGLIAGIPFLLETLGVVLPMAIAALVSKAVFYSSLVGMLISGLPVDDVKEVIEETPKDLPLTAKSTLNK